MWTKGRYNQIEVEEAQTIRNIALEDAALEIDIYLEDFKPLMNEAQIVNYELIARRIRSKKVSISREV